MAEIKKSGMNCFARLLQTLSKNFTELNQINNRREYMKLKEAKAMRKGCTSDMLPLKVLLFISPFIIGLYFEWATTSVSVFLALYLTYLFCKNKYLRIPQSPTLIALTILLLFFAVSPLWAVDKGMSVMGFAKFLPLPLFALALAQTDITRREQLFDVIPYSSACMTVISFALSFIPELSNFFMINGRLAGFMQYSNTFALFLLTGIVITIMHWNNDIKSIVIVAVDLFGVAASGSRTCFLLLILCIIVFLLKQKNKVFRFTVIALMLLLIAATAIYATVTSNLTSIARYLTTSLSDSSLLTRLLYWADALPVILSHPFGMGYMGYYFLQGSFQSGVYGVMFVHNELLQLLLDIGWIPAGFIIWALVRTVKSRSENVMGVALTALICAHCMMDFDMQYISVGFILVCAMGVRGEREIYVKKQTAVAISTVMVCAICLYFGVVSGVYAAKNYEMTLKIYPHHTMSMIKLLPDAHDELAMNQLADEIIEYNDSVSIAYSAKAKYAFSKGDIERMIMYKQEAIKLSKYSLDEYLDYCDMLCTAYTMYARAGDSYSADYCRERILEIPEMLESVLDSSSPIAWKIQHKPELELPEEYAKVMNELKIY